MEQRLQVTSLEVYSASQILAFPQWSARSQPQSLQYLLKNVKQNVYFLQNLREF